LNTEAALFRMMFSQSWPHIGASAISRCCSPAARNRLIAFFVALVHAGLTSRLVPNGSLPRLITT
jgi:hypothetical protein